MTAARTVISLTNQLSDLTRMAIELEQFAERHKLAGEIVNAVNVALEELVTNTISYGYDDTAGHTIVINLTLEDGTLEAVIEDDAKPYDPFLRPEPNVKAGVDERGIGGLGVHLVRHLMDGFTYARNGNRNVVTISKRTTPDGTEDARNGHT